MDDRIMVYSTPTCPYCKAAKQYLDQNNVVYEDIDVSQDREAAKRMVEQSGQMGVPQIVIGKKTIVGFDKKELEKELANK